MRFRRTGLRFVVLVAIVATVMALTATAALAGQPNPTLNVAELQSKIDANGGSMPGYLKTVLKGSKIVTLSVDVLGVTTGFGSGPADMSSLILFESNDATITKIGGIAAGMSGSPIYVHDDADDTDKLIGALSYGDIFTTGGTGLATPIEAMVNIQNDYVVSGMPRRLSSPVIIDGQIKDRVMIAPNPGAVTVEPANTIVAKPLSAMYIGGLDPKSRMYKAYSKILESKGISVLTPLEGGLSSVTSTYNAPFEGGSAVAVLAARGDLWVGGIGTVTYTDGNSVLAFGHPAFRDGDSGLYLCNAWIDGIWPSTYTAYKLGRPAAVRGTLTQDRTAGIMGVDGIVPDEVSITAQATRGSRVATSAVHVPKFVADSSTGNYYGLATASAYVAGSRLFDAATNPGSAVTTTTVTVLDGSDNSTYTLVRRNMYSDSRDISMAIVLDVDEMVSSLQNVNANGIAKAHVLSVDLETTFSAARREAEIVDLNVTGGLKTGDNTVTVSFLQYGEAATQTVNVPLHIPSDVPLTGQLSAHSVNDSGDGGSFVNDSGDGDSYSATLFLEQTTGIGPSGSESGVDRRTARDVVDELNAAVDNTVVKVAFQPEGITDGDSESDVALAPAVAYGAVETTVATDWVVAGGASKTAPAFAAHSAVYGPLAYGSPTFVVGELAGVQGKGIVTVTGLGSTKTYSVIDGTVMFMTPRLYKKTTLVLTFLGNDSALPVQTTLVINVCAKTTLKASKTTLLHNTPVTLTAKVYRSAGGSVSFQRWNGWRWASMKTVTVPSTGTATYKYYPPKKGTYKIRARFNGSSTNVAKNSSIVTLKVK